MEMIKKLMFVAVMIGTGFVQGAEDVLPSYASAEDTVSQISLAPSYRTFVGQPEDTVSQMSLVPSYGSVVDFFDEEALLAEAFERFPDLTGENARRLVREGYLDCFNRLAPFYIQPVYQDLQLERINERNNWLSFKTQKAIERYFLLQSRLPFSRKEISAGQRKFSFRQYIEATFQKYVSFINLVGRARRRKGNPYLAMLTHNRDKRMETKQLLDTILSSIKTIHRRLLQDEKNSFHSRSSSDKQEINRAMEELDAVFQRFSANVPYSRDEESYYAPDPDYVPAPEAVPYYD